MFTKPYRFTIRDEIEEIIKEIRIDRSRFHEFSKFRYEEIIRKFYFAFSDRKNYTPSQITLFYHHMHFRPELETEYIDCFFRTDNWIDYMETIRKEIPDRNQKLFLILGQGWVYEGYADELFSVLKETSWALKDCYIVSSKFNWFIAVSDIDLNATMYRR